MKKTPKFHRVLAVVLVLVLMLCAVPANAATGGATVDMTPVVQFPGAWFTVNAVDYLCAVDLGQPVIHSESDTALTPGTTITLDLYFYLGDGWWGARVPEMKGTPQELFTVRVDKTSGGELISEPVWKTYPDDGYGPRYYLELTVLESPEATALDFTVTLTQPGAGEGGSDNIGAAYHICGTTAGQAEPEMPTVPLKLGGTVYDCIADFGTPDTSTGGTELKTGDKINFPLLWVDGNGTWYTVCHGDLQGDLNTLVTVKETITAGDAVLGDPVWKYRGSYNSYYLEYTVLEGSQDQDIQISVQLTQPEQNREGSVLSFTGTYITVPAPEITKPTVPINLGGTVYDCIVDFGDPVTSTGKTDMLEGDTVCFPLKWVDGSGNWWTVCHGELQGDPAELFEVVETFTAGGQWFGEPVWKHDWPYNSYYLEYKILDPDVAQDLELSVQIQQSETCYASVKTFRGMVDKRFDLWADKLEAQYPAAENQGKVILLGSSTMEQWTQYAAHLAPLEALNFGMGGSRVEHIADKNSQLLVPYAPQAVVVYTGGNDITLDGQTGEEVAAELKAYLTSVLEDLPGIPVFYVASFTTRNETQENAAQRQILITQLKTFCEETENLYFIDGAAPINGDPEKMPELFKEDGTHLNSVGYSLFGPVIAKEVCAVLGVEPDDPDPEPEEEILLPLSPIKLGGTVYDCLTTFGAPMTSTGTTQLSTGDTVCFPLVWMDANGNWYTVCYGELQGDPAKLYKVSKKVYAGGALLSDPVWKHDWEYNAYYLEYRVSGNTDGKLDFALTLEQPAKGRKGEPSRFTGKFVNHLLQDDTYPQYPETMVETNVTYTREPAKRYCGADFTIAGVNYAPDQWAVELIEPRTEGGKEGSLYGGSTILFELYYKTNAWYPVRRDEINQPPQELLDIFCQFVKGQEYFTEPRWVEVDNQAGSFWAIALEAKPVEEVTEFEFSIGITQNNDASVGSVYTCRGIISPGTPYAQVPMSAGAGLAVERLEECKVFPQTTFTLNGIRYSEKWPIDLAAPVSPDAILTDDSIIYADLMFHVGGAWYALRKPEVNEPIEERIRFDFQVLEGGECLGEPRLVTRHDGYSEIWNIEIPVNSHKEVNEFCFTIQLLDGQLKGSKYQVRGIVQDEEISLDVQPTQPVDTPDPVGFRLNWTWIAAGGAGLAVLAVLVVVIVLIARKRKK